MSISGIGTRSSFSAQALVDMRQQLDDLQRQLGTGKKTTTYAGLGADRGLALSLRSRLSDVESYGSSITNVDLRLTLAQDSLSRMGEVSSRIKASLVQSNSISGTTAYKGTQELSLAGLDELVQLLNTRAGDRYLFGGRAVDTKPVESMDTILNGSGTQAGLRQIIAERKAADLGAGDLGRLVVAPPVGAVVTVAEDVAGSPFGFKLDSASTTFTGATLTGPTGSPAGLTIDLGATNPNAGEALTVVLRLPDGSEETLKLEATASATPGTGQFSLGTTPAATAINLQAAIAAAVQGEARTSLAAASAIAATDDFFDASGATMPMRVAGPPFEAATALAPGTPANTVSWYRGETGTDPARGTATARVDTAVSVSYGMRADEPAFRDLMKHLAVTAVVDLSATDPASNDRYAALRDRMVPAFGGVGATQTIADVQSELTGAQMASKTAKDRHIQTNSTLQGLLDGIEGVSPQEVAVQILALQTRLQASLQTTSMLYQLNLTNFL